MRMKPLYLAALLLSILMLVACAGSGVFPAPQPAPAVPADTPSEPSAPPVSPYVPPENDAEPIPLYSVPAPSPTPETEADVEPEPVLEPEPEIDPEDAPEPPTIPTQNSGIDPSKPMVALTFDDGPGKYMSRILDTLELHNARATFFTIGSLLDAQKDTVLRAFDMDCEILGHSWSHRDLTKLGEKTLREEILNTGDAIEAITGGVAARLFRPPYGAYNNTVSNVSAELGFTLINWSLDTFDWKIKDADRIYNSIMDRVKSNDIILCHDLHAPTADAVERIIPSLIEMGYQLVTVSELLFHTYGELEAGQVYVGGK
ncbi:MAG: polysaccharide deacetylase family protein [Oscillospiraceae bacterium]|jgi:peptidoglycan/xylan/chitin deacetylase (PgdA/CDA1 family)|nr:polysaccharide deacetylase family protein [Oscillospiraceae bacterium]